MQLLVHYVGPVVQILDALTGLPARDVAAVVTRVGRRGCSAALAELADGRQVPLDALYSRRGPGRTVIVYLRERPAPDRGPVD